MSKIRNAIDFAKALCALSAVTLAGAAQAYLGGFEEQDGYHFGTPIGNTLGANDVTRYNAGEYGTNNGGPGGSAFTITPDSGLWRVITGGRLLNRSDDYYVIQHTAPFGHSSPQVLGMTTGNSAFVGVDTLYRYSFDARDFDGAAPSTLGASFVNVGFDWCPQNATASTLASPGASIQFLDSAGTIWFELGSFGGTESISYRIGSGAWVAAGFNASGNVFDHVSLGFDLANDTVSFSFLQTATATSFNILTAAPLGGDLDYLAQLGLFMKAENAKNFLDDFDFRVGRAVPEPATVPLLAAALAASIAWRRRRGRA